MKQIALIMMMIAGLLASCSTDDVLLNNESNNGNNPEVVVPFSDPSLSNCVNAAALGGSATLSSYAAQQITFNWNNAVDYDSTKTYVSHIEIAEDPACPSPVWGTPVAATYPIDAFNSSSIVVTGVSAKCFQWRIVINGYVGSALDCTTTTDWKPATYLQ